MSLLSASCPDTLFVKVDVSLAGHARGYEQCSEVELSEDIRSGDSPSLTQFCGCSLTSHGMKSPEAF